MKYKELKEHLDKFEDWQLEQPVVVFNNDEEIGKEVDFLEEQGEDIYWYEGDCMGPLTIAEEWIADNPDENITLNDFVIVRKGQPTLHITDSL